MTQLALIVGMRSDEVNTIASTLAFLDRGQSKPLLERDGVTLLGDNLVLLDPTKAHGVLVQACAILERKCWPYLLLRMDGPASLASGKLSLEVSALLVSAGVQIVAQSS